MLGRVLSLTGGPLIIAAFAYVPIEQRKLIRNWIARLEHIVRKLLLVEAAQVCVPPTRPRTYASRRPLRAAKRAKGFILTSHRRTSTRRRHAPLKTTRDHARLLAARLAAVEHVFLNPAPYARRLARRLQRKPTAAIALAATPARSTVIDHADSRLPIDATAAALVAASLFQDSS